MHMSPHRAPLKADYWQAVLERNAAYDHQFVYAVSSTAIYCLPSCPSKKPKPQNVSFYAFPELAEAAGFRPCKRCKPNTPKSHTQLERIHQICRYIAEHNSTQLTLEHLAKTFQLSPGHLQRTFKALVGISPQAFQESYRIQAIKSSLNEGKDIVNALYDAGYGSSSRLYSKSHSQLGMTPKNYQHKGENMTIFYHITDAPLGALLVAATPTGICSIRLGEDTEKLRTELMTEFSNASIEEDCEFLQDWVKHIIKHLEGKEPHLALPLDIRATAFQKQVWQALQNIPYGETRSYAQIAQSLGKPSAVRAVASACAKNPVALVIPCHRVIRSDGSLGGYRWGLERKEQLLKQENTP